MSLSPVHSFLQEGADRMSARRFRPKQDEDATQVSRGRNFGQEKVGGNVQDHHLSPFKWI